MADTVDVKVVNPGPRHYIVHLTNISDGTGESAVTKVNVSGLTGPNGKAPTYTAIDEIMYSIQGFTNVSLFWDATTDDEIVKLASGNGMMHFRDVGGLVDPKSAGFNGNIILTTAGAVSGATYDITLVIRLKD